MSQARNLSRAEKTKLAAWLRDGKRTPSPADELWALLATSPPEVRDQVQQALANF